MKSGFFRDLSNSSNSALFLLNVDAAQGDRLVPPSSNALLPFNKEDVQGAIDMAISYITDGRGKTIDDQINEMNKSGFDGKQSTIPSSAPQFWI